jgi:RNA polymerase sigma factor (sigma-70 family)
MGKDRINPLLWHLRSLAVSGRAQEASDGELVDWFLAGEDRTAFSALLQRHGPMVLGLCRRVLRNDQDAEDAFQATFLVFTRKARSLRARASVGNWLYGVAYRTALKARSAAARRRDREAAAPVRAPGEPLAEMTVTEAQAIVDEELARLPDKFRAPLVLCCLEGLARDEAARQLGWPDSLVKSRLEQARERLGRRLAQRGLTFAAGMMSLGLLGTAAQAAVPAPLAGATVQAASLVAAGAAPAAVVSSPVANLVEEMMRSFLLTKVKFTTAAVLACVLLGTRE